MVSNWSLLCWYKKDRLVFSEYSPIHDLQFGGAPVSLRIFYPCYVCKLFIYAICKVIRFRLLVVTFYIKFDFSLWTGSFYTKTMYQVENCPQFRRLKTMHLVWAKVDALWDNGNQTRCKKNQSLNCPNIYLDRTQRNLNTTSVHTSSFFLLFSYSLGLVQG